MRVIVATVIGWVALSAVSVEAAAFAPANFSAAELGSGELIELGRDGCGYAYYRTR